MSRFNYRVVGARGAVYETTTLAEARKVAGVHGKIYTLNPAPKKYAKGLTQDKLRGRQHELYQTYIGTILAPKSNLPCSIFIKGTDIDRYVLSSPDRTRWYGSGYFEVNEEDGISECVRQHMSGVYFDEDRGLGLGTALYCAGVVVLEASLFAKDNNLDNLDEIGLDDDPDEGCTYSASSSANLSSGGRTSLADRAWNSLVKYGLADKDEVQAYATEGFYFDVEDLIEDKLEHNYDSIDEVYPSSLEGHVTGYRDVPINRMFYSTVRDSELLIDLNPEFFTAYDEDERDDDEKWYPQEWAIVPPKEWPNINWNFTPVNFLRYFAHNAAQNSEPTFNAIVSAFFDDGEDRLGLYLRQGISPWDNLAQGMLPGFSRAKKLPGYPIDVSKETPLPSVEQFEEEESVEADRRQRGLTEEEDLNDLLFGR